MRQPPGHPDTRTPGQYSALVASIWGTVSFERTVVGVARTVTSTARMLDALELLRPDPRIGALFAYDDRSVFGEGVLDLLRDVGASAIAWSDLDTVECDLIVSASENVEGAPAGVPLLVVPHGVGFHKLVPDGSGSGRRVSGLVPGEALEGRRFVLAVSDEGAARYLSAVQPQAALHASVTGDLAWEQLEASAELRRSYRSALGCSDDQRLVVISSTWGPRSQFGTWSGLAGELAGSLPADEYRIVQILHPNVWASLGAYRVRTLMRDALDAGVALTSPYRGWQAALVAADLVIGDHGSVTFYGAALGRPVLLAAFGSGEIVADTPMAALGMSAARLSRRVRLLPQVAQALGGPSGELAGIARRALPPGVPAGERLRSEMYGLLGLVAPSGPAQRRAAPEPVAERREVAACVVYAEVVDDGGPKPLIVLSRYPAAAERGQSSTPDTVHYLMAPADEPDRVLAEAADVVLGHGVDERASAAGACDGLLERFPGCAAAAVPVAGGCLLRLRGRRWMLAVSIVPTASFGERSGVLADGTVAAACAYALLVLKGGADDDAGANSARVRLGAHLFTLSIARVSD